MALQSLSLIAQRQDAEGPLTTNGELTPLQVDARGNLRAVLAGTLIGDEISSAVHDTQTRRLIEEMVQLLREPLGVDGSGVVQPVSGRLTALAPDDLVTTGVIAAIDGALSIAPAAGVGTVVLQLTGTWTGTVQFEVTLDGITWVSRAAYSGTASVTSSTANGVFVLPTAGFTTVRVRASAWTSGAALVTVRASVGLQGVTSVSGAVAIDSLPNEGQQTMANSISVAVASDQTAVPVSGPLTDTQLRATAVPVSGTVTATGPLTDTQLRATAVPVSGTVTANPALGQGKALLFVAIAQVAAGTTELVAAQGGSNKIKVVSYAFTLSLAGTAKFTGTADLTGAFDIAASGGAVVVGQPSSHLFETAANAALSIVTTLGAARGHLAYFVEA